MAYSNGYAVAVVVGGNVVEERQDGVVAVPFGAEYTIRLINRNGKRALANVIIDGNQVTGGGLIVPAYGTVNLERPTDKAVKFRFASTESEAAHAHGKAGPDTDGSKGLVRVEWYPEKEYWPFQTGSLGAFTVRAPECQPFRHDSGQWMNKSSLHADHGTVKCSAQPRGIMGRETKTSGGIVTPDLVATNSCLEGAPADLQSGVTVEGGHSSQTFRTAAFDPDYSRQTVLLVKLKGYVADEGIPRTGTRYCPQCRTRTHKVSDRYCRHCGEQL